ncbi:glycosyltransferase [Leptospira sp. FAT2]|nr:glycosyltransferase [Leptospira sanjuanensis]MCG6193034.1 glycosyltransferase [Leptospira sanjuanensis]
MTERLILCLKRQTYKNFKILLIDDGSKDGTSEMATSHFPESAIIKGSGDWWWGGSLQQGYNWLKRHEIETDDDILIVNDDVEFADDFLEIGIELLKKNKDSLFLAKSYSRIDNSLQDSGVRVDWSNLSFKMANSQKEINVLSTRGLFLKVRTFFKIGGFYPRLIPHYQSDYEFTHRAYLKGFTLRTSDSLFLLEDPNETGIRTAEVRDIKDFIKVYFNKKSNYYLLSWVSFVILRCPWRWKVRNVIRILLWPFPGLLRYFVQIRSVLHFLAAFVRKFKRH